MPLTDEHTEVAVLLMWRKYMTEEFMSVAETIQGNVIHHNLVYVYKVAIKNYINEQHFYKNPCVTAYNQAIVQSTLLR